jgi:hypothetical protein
MQSVLPTAANNSWSWGVSVKPPVGKPTLFARLPPRIACVMTNAVAVYPTELAHHSSEAKKLSLQGLLRCRDREPDPAPAATGRHSRSGAAAGGRAGDSGRSAAPGVADVVGKIRSNSRFDGERKSGKNGRTGASGSHRSFGNLQPNATRPEKRVSVSYLNY